MPKIIPFKAVRPAKEMAALVVSRPYEQYNEKELEATLAFNPYSFLHIINPGYKFHHEVSGKERFSLVRNRYLEFLEDKVFLKDEMPSFYIYKLKTRSREFCGIFAAASTHDYKNNLIKKHEDTLEKRETLFKDYLKTVGFNAEPVLLTYSENAKIDEVIAEETATEPLFAFTTTDKTTHYLWAINQPEKVNLIAGEFQSMPAVYIADGHHRSASSLLLSEELKKENSSHNGHEPYNFFLTYLIPEQQLNIYEFNRLVKGLNGLSKEEFLIKLDAFYRIENRGKEAYKPSKKHHFSMYLEGEFYSLYLRKTRYAFTNPLSELDTQILYTTVLKPILGINDLRNDSRIQYGFGKHNLLEMKTLIDNGTFTVGFGMVPVSVSEIKNIADAGLRMPPKSTYIEPKLKSGLVIYEF